MTMVFGCYVCTSGQTSCQKRWHHKVSLEINSCIEMVHTHTITTQPPNPPCHTVSGQTSAPKHMFHYHTGKQCIQRQMLILGLINNKLNAIIGIIIMDTNKKKAIPLVFTYVYNVYLSIPTFRCRFNCTSVFASIHRLFTSVLSSI